MAVVAPGTRLHSLLCFRVKKTDDKDDSQPPPKPPGSSPEPPTPSSTSSAETTSGSCLSTISFLSLSNLLVDPIPADVPQEPNIENRELIQGVMSSKKPHNMKHLTLHS